MERISGETCTIDDLTLLPDDDCFFAVTGPSTLKSSVMGVPYFPGNDQWCDITEERQHQDDIPSKHNTMCNGISTFEVVRRNQDFEDFVPKNDNETDTTPEFIILQPLPSGQPFISILDYSGSMDGSRINNLKQGFKRFMTYDIDLDLKIPLGVVKFSSRSNTFIAHEIVPIDSEAIRNEIINEVNKGKKGETRATCLHTGIQKGLEALKNFGADKGGVGIFLTDGGQSCGDGLDDWLTEIIDDVLAQEMKFCTIAFSNDADPRLEALAARTNGASFLVPDDSGPEYVNNALAGCLQFLASTPSNQKFSEILQKSYSDKIDQIKEDFIIDQYSGKDLRIQIDYDIKGTYTLSSSIDNEENSLTGVNVVELSYPSVNPGPYSITLKPSSNAKINFLTILIKSKSSDGNEPLAAKCWTSSGSEDLQLSQEDPDKLVIYGQAMQGMNPVINARIDAIVTDDSNEEKTVTLKDDGIAPDLIKNDGIYSAFHIVPNKDGKSRYSLVCKVNGDDNTKVVNSTLSNRGKSLPSHPSASAPLCCGSVAVKVLHIFIYILQILYILIN